MLNLNNSTTQTKVQAPVWLVDYSGEVVSEIPTGNRDSDGRFLRQHVSLNVAPRIHTSGDVAMAEAFNCEPDELFAGRSGKR